MSRVDGLTSVEIRGSMASIGPGFIPDAVFKPSIRASNRDIQDQVKRLVKRRVRSAGMRPWVGDQWIICRPPSELAALEHVCVLGEGPIHDLLQWIVHPSKKVIFWPFKAKSMKPLGKICSAQSLAARWEPICV